METNARYLTIGVFVVCTILAGFGFVFWLDRTGGLAKREAYMIRFENTVSGLQPGAAVLFDGMRVGEVSSLALDPAEPKMILAQVAVAASTPIRADTKAGIEFQGLMGTAAVSLQGGSPGAPRLAAQEGRPPVLVADPEAGRSLTEAARGALSHVDGILSDNAAPLKDTIANFREFSGALARNADKIDALLTGLQRMTGSGPQPPPIPVYDLAAPKLARLAGTRAGQLAIPEPSSVVALQTQRLLTRSPEGRIAPIGTMQWSDSLPKLLQAKLLEGLGEAGIAATEAAPVAPGPDDRQLLIDLRRFDLDTGAVPTAEVTFSAKLLSSDGHVLRTRLIQARSPGSLTDEGAAVRAMGEAFSDASRQLVAWLGGEG